MVKSGKVIRILANFYYIEDETEKVWECFARSRLFKEGKKILVGDIVDIEPSNETQAAIINVHERNNSIIKPPASNINQVLVVFSASEPEFDLYNLDRYLTFISNSLSDIEVSICINKMDLGNVEIDSIYKQTNFKLFYISAKKQIGLSELFEELKNKNTVLTGPSGVGKSSLIKAFVPDLKIKIGEVNAISRGKHTTRSVELIKIKHNNNTGYLFDTPGFTMFSFENFEKESILKSFPEFSNTNCAFSNCFHNGEEGCSLNTSLEKIISKSRYESYLNILSESDTTETYSKRKENQLKVTGGKKGNRRIPKIDKLDRSKSRKKKNQDLNKFNADLDD